MGSRLNGTMASIESNLSLFTAEENDIWPKITQLISSTPRTRTSNSYLHLPAFFTALCSFTKGILSWNIMMLQANCGVVSDLLLAESVFSCIFQICKYKRPTLQGILVFFFPLWLAAPPGLRSLGPLLFPLGSCPGTLTELGNFLWGLILAPSPTYGKSQRAPTVMVPRTQALALSSYSGRF